MGIAHADNQEVGAWHKDQVYDLSKSYSKYRVHYPRPTVFDNSTQF